MRIGELAANTGCDIETIRFYEREGLLDKPARDASGYRRYDGRALARVRFIRHCRSLDIALPEVRRLLACTAAPERSCAEVDSWLDRHIAGVRQRIEALHALEAQLAALRRTCDGNPAHACAILDSFVSAAQAHGCACHVR
jgi:Cd(II)/Pb(II)-responsive transcriptional regulator